MRACEEIVRTRTLIDAAQHAITVASRNIAELTVDARAELMEHGGQIDVSIEGRKVRVLLSSVGTICVEPVSGERW